MSNGIVLSEQTISQVINLKLVIGILSIIFLSLYVIFSFIVVRQVQLLNHTLGTGLSPVLKVISIANLIFAIIIFVVSVVMVI